MHRAAISFLREESRMLRWFIDARAKAPTLFDFLKSSSGNTQSVESWINSPEQERGRLREDVCRLECALEFVKDVRRVLLNPPKPDYLVRFEDGRCMDFSMANSFVSALGHIKNFARQCDEILARRVYVACRVGCLFVDNEGLIEAFREPIKKCNDVDWVSDMQSFLSALNGQVADIICDGGSFENMAIEACDGILENMLPTNAEIIDE